MEEFKGVTIYDWTHFWRELSKRIADIAADPNRNTLLKEKAGSVFGLQHYLYTTDEIDPFSFLYTLAQKNTVNVRSAVYEKVRTEFTLTSAIPTDWIFPTPPNQVTASFNNEGKYTDKAGQPISVDILWDLFLQAFAGNPLSNNTFLKVLSIKNVGVPKLTQALFLANPSRYLPIDERIFWLSDINQSITEEIKAGGFDPYQKFMDEVSVILPNCKYYEINLLCYLMSGDKPRLKLTDHFCQVSSWVDGQNQKDYYDDFCNDSYIRTGGAGDHKSRGGLYPIDKVHDGDIVFVRRGTKNLGGIAVIIDNQYLNGGYDDDRVMQVIWINKTNQKLQNTALGDWNGFNIATDDTYNKFRSVYEKTFELIEKIYAKQGSSLQIQPLKPIERNISKNLILYGPPGTGKTYSTITKAIEIANPSYKFPSTDNEVDRELVKKEYRRLEMEGKIAFITFHQSMSYEDFIEGIKPQLGTDKLTYMLVDGVFKSLCEKARHISGNFTEVIDKLKALVSEEDGKVPTIIKSATTTFDIIYRGGTVFYVHPHNSVKNDSWYSVNIEYIRQAFEADSLEGVYNSTYVREIITYLKQNFGLVRGNKRETEVKENYVIIIDEINRGNISQIFGELITLLEADKREGQPEALSAKLPYSKLDFSVPDNVYIIGTMNTADRSVEALDSALRRRFSFEHMPPKKERVLEEVAGIKLRTIFEAINDRLEYLLDSDHQIGHSYFMKMLDESTIISGFKNEVIPLLKEYFYNDYGKLRLVLGDGLVKVNKGIKTNTLFAVPDEGYITEKVIYYIVPDENLFVGVKSIVKDAS